MNARQGSVLVSLAGMHRGSAVRIASCAGRWFDRWPFRVGGCDDAIDPLVQKAVGRAAAVGAGGRGGRWVVERMRKATS